MTLKKIKSGVFLLVILLSNLPIDCMEESNLEKDESIEQDTYSFECLPNELLLPIFYYKIQHIINTNEPAHATKEFDELLSSRCLAKKRFDEFKDDLKKFFAVHKKPEISDVAVDLENYIISFKIGDVEFKSDANNVDDIQSINNIVDPSITEAGLTTAGEELAKKATVPVELRTMANDVLRAEFDKAITADQQATTPEEKAKAAEQQNKIRILIKPILAAYKNTPTPKGKDDKDLTPYKEALVYKDLLDAYYGTNIPADLQ